VIVFVVETFQMNRICPSTPPLNPGIVTSEALLMRSLARFRTLITTFVVGLMMIVGRMIRESAASTVTDPSRLSVTVMFRLNFKCLVA
jgi:hypothetical protein